MQRQFLREVRIKNGLSQEAAAMLAGISRSFYNNIERGKRTPSVKVANNIAKALKTTVDDIFFASHVA